MILLPAQKLPPHFPKCFFFCAYQNPPFFGEPVVLTSFRFLIFFLIKCFLGFFKGFLSPPLLHTHRLSDRFWPWWTKFSPSLFYFIFNNLLKTSSEEEDTLEYQTFEHICDIFSLSKDYFSIFVCKLRANRQVVIVFLSVCGCDLKNIF